MNYANAKIYRLWSPSTDLNYIGSTCTELRKRLHEHKCHYKRYTDGKRGYISSFEVVKQGDCRIVLVEAKACNDKLEMLRLEAHHIRNNDCVNKVINPGALLLAGRQQYNAEWYQNNRDAIRAQTKEYYQNNRDAIRAQTKEYYQNNRDAIRARQDTPNECECGGRYTRNNKTHHKKTTLHRLYIQNLHNELNHLANL